MRLKSYYAASVAEAIENARLELGPEAMLLNSRELGPDQRHLGAFEVVFGITGEPILPRRTDTPAVTNQATAFAKPVAATERESIKFESKPAEVPNWRKTLEELVARQEAPVPVTPSPMTSKLVLTSPVEDTPAKSAAARLELRETKRRSAEALPLQQPVSQDAKAREADALAEELNQLRQQIERVKSSISLSNQAASQVAPAAPARTKDMDALVAQMAQLGFSAAFAQRMSESAMERLQAFAAQSGSLSYLGGNGYTLEHLQQVLVTELQSRFQVKPELGVAGTGRRIAMVVGPPGAGKTTTLVKLAIKYGLERRIPVQLLSLDTVRVGGSEQLGTFARILNADFDALHTTAALSDALADCRTDQLILIDCPGYAPADMDEAAGTAAFLRANPAIDVHLVLPAFMNPSSLAAAAARFSTFGPSKLLFTHLDEVDSLGGALEYTIKSGLPTSFLTNGQSIPQDLQEANKDRFTQGILNGAAAYGAA